MRRRQCDVDVSRGQNGQFLSHRSSGMYDGHVSANNAMKKRKETQHSLFQGYMMVFFLTGDESDFIPFSSKSGPFVQTYERIMKRSYTLGRIKRSGKLQQYYEDQKRHGVPSKILRISTRNAQCHQSRPSRVDVYKYRRLPNILNQRDELEPLKAWLQVAEKDKALIGSWQNAYEICCAAIGTYRTVKGKKAYIGFPVSILNSVSSETSSDGDSSAIEQLEQNENSKNQDRPDTVSTPAAENRSGGAAQPSVQPSSSDVDSTWTGLQEERHQRMPPVRIRPSPRSARSFRNAVRFLDIARSNSIFEVLTKTLDGNDSRFHLMANPFVLPFMGEPRVPKVLKDALYHCQAKVFSTSDQEAVKTLENNLRKVHEDVKKVRQVYEMKKVQDMNWSFE